MSDGLDTTIDGFDHNGQWKAFHVPLPVKIEKDVDFDYRASTDEPFSFGTGPTPEAALDALRGHLGKQYEFARWAAEMVD